MTNSFMHADIFFFLTSVAVVVFTIVLVIAGILVIQTLNEAKAFMRRVRRDTDRALDAMEDAAVSFAEKAGGLTGAVAGLGYRLWRNQKGKERGRAKKSSK
jgi:hypothetical protein